MEETEHVNVSTEEVRSFRSYLIHEAAKSLTLYPAALQVTLLVGPTGEIISYPIFDLNDGHSEEQFFSTLKTEGKTRFQHMLTMWREHTIDIPKRSVLLRIRELDGNNENCCVLLQGENGVNGFQLSKLF